MKARHMEAARRALDESKALRLRYQDGRPVHEVARELGVQPREAAAAIRAALRRLRQPTGTILQ